jgi:hypothetical protein
MAARGGYFRFWPIAEMPAARLRGCLPRVNLPARTTFVNPMPTPFQGSLDWGWFPRALPLGWRWTGPSGLVEIGSRFPAALPWASAQLHLRGLCREPAMDPPGF